MSNNEIAEYFSLMARLMDLHGENSFRSKSYSIAAFTLERLPDKVETMSDAALFATKGIGDQTGKKVRELIAKGRLKAMDDLLAATPPGVLDIMQIKGLGPKKTAVIWKELGIESIGELEYACNENRLVTLKGFGAKTQDSVLQSIELLRSYAGYYLFSEAYEFAMSVVDSMQAGFPDELTSLTGNIRLQPDIVENVDIITTVTPSKLMPILLATPEVKISEENDNDLTVQFPNHPLMILHFTSMDDFYKDLFLTTGPEYFCSQFAEKFTIPAKPVSEEQIFEHNKMQYVHPALRAQKDALDKALCGKIPTVIKPEDIRGIIHSHSKWSDGSFTIEEMANEARKKGFEYLVLSDHSQSAYYANGLNPERIAAQHAEIDALNKKLAPFRIFKSIESDILFDGNLDYTPEVLRTFDLVIASVHSNLKMNQEKAMERVLAAIRNPFTNILGHPTGRLLLSRPGYPLDMKAIIDECSRCNVVIEINAHPRRLDLDWQWIDYAMQQGVLLSIDPDAHELKGFDDIFYGAMAAQKGGLTKTCNLSSYTLHEMEEFIAAQKTKSLR